MDTQKIVFMNKKLNLRLAGLLYLPDAFDLSNDYPAVVVTGPMLSVKEQAQSVYAKKLTEAGYVTLVFDGAYFGESEGLPRVQELPDVKESDIEGAVDYLTSLPYVDNNRIGGLGICGSGSYMSVAGVKEPRLKAITAIVPAISDISTSAMAGFFKPADEVQAAKEAYEKGEGEIEYSTLCREYLTRALRITTLPAALIRDGRTALSHGASSNWSSITLRTS